MFIARNRRSCWASGRHAYNRACVAIPNISEAGIGHVPATSPSSSSALPAFGWDLTDSLNLHQNQYPLRLGPSSGHERRIHWPAGFSHYASIHSSRDGAESEPDVADLLSDRAVDHASEILGAFENALASGSDAVSNASEVAALATEHWLPTTLLQQLIENVHIYTGCQWWIAIAATTVAMRTLLIPLSLYQMGAIARLAIVKPEIELLTKRMKESGYAPLVVERCQKDMAALLKKHRTSPFTPLVGALVQGPLFVFFFFAIQGMAKGVDSFQTGGAYWFLDLTTPDPTYILPALTAVTFLASIELNAADGMAGQPQAGQQKNILRLLGVAMVPLTMAFPKALFCYWFTANIFTLGQGTVFKSKWLKKSMGVPDVLPAPTPPPPSTGGMWGFGGTPSPPLPPVTVRPPRGGAQGSGQGGNQKHSGRVKKKGKGGGFSR